ncbi:MAG TPA: LPXTG cell wall anchor domain-containing protein [Acidimicrobiales bacterium]|nr:LPXTG cell wall anchor domain-containing protein [Acidimicrobiales bacterium]
MFGGDRSGVRGAPRGAWIVLALSVSALTIVFGSPAGAEVVQVGGGAFGFETSVSLFGGPPNSRGPIPAVTLPANGADPPITASEQSGKAEFGPAVIVETGAMQVSTGGKTGADGVATSSATIAGVSEGPGPFLYEEVKSTCEAKESGASGSATIRGGRLETKYNADTEDPIETEAVPSNPAPNFERTGTLDHVGDSYRIVFNEQIRQAGGITVNAVHMYLLGPIAKGELIIGQTRCSTNASGGGGDGGGGAAAATPTTPAGGAGGSSGGDSSGGGASGGGSATGGTGSGMPNTGTDIVPLALVGSELVAGGAAAVLWARRRRPWPRR